MGWSSCGMFCIDGLIIQPPRELTSAGDGWRYCPYGDGIDVGHNGRYVGIEFVDDDDDDGSGTRGGDGQLLSSWMYSI